MTRIIQLYSPWPAPNSDKQNEELSDKHFPAESKLSRICFHRETVMLMLVFPFYVLFLFFVIALLQTWMNWSSIAFSIALFFTVALCYNASCPTCYSPSNPYWTMQTLLQDPVFYLLCVVTPVTALLPRYTLLHS